MSILNTDFSNELKISTMTYLVSLGFELNLEQLFEFFPCIEPNNQIVKMLNSKKVKKVNIPHFQDKVGQIISIRFEDSYRGILKNKSAKKMKNAISMHICLKSKNIAVKIFNSGIHLTGVKDESNITEVMSYLIYHIQKVHYDILILTADKYKTLQVYNFIVSNLKSENEVLIISEPIPDCIDSKIYNILTRDIAEFTQIPNYITVLQYMINVKPATIPGDIKYSTEIAMFNYNYKLGFDLNLNSFAKNLDSYQKENSNLPYKFTIIYDNTLHSYVKLEVPYKKECNSMIREKKKQAKHTFMIYKNLGSVTQSGPKPELMLDLYNYFRNVVQYLKPKIDNSVIYRDSTESERETDSTSKLEKLFDEFSSDSESESEKVSSHSEVSEKSDSDSFVKYIMKFNSTNL
jgi:hypothetical protein